MSFPIDWVYCIKAGVKMVSIWLNPFNQIETIPPPPHKKTFNNI